MDYAKLPVLGSIFEWMDDNDMDYGPFVTAIAVSLLVMGLVVFNISGAQTFAVVVALAPLWLPVVLFLVFYNKWMDMIGVSYYLNQGRATLRIKLPEEILKSPEAMEVVLAQIHNTASPDNLMQTYLDGKRPLPFSFEIVSIGGEVRFYVNVPRKKTKDAFEANIYAQYPGIEVVEEPVDYAAEIPVDFDSTDYDVFAVHMGKKEDGELPLKTYIDYGLASMPKEEEKIDPLTPTLEVIANIKPHERIYIQILCTSYRKESFKHGQLFPDTKSWKDKVNEKISFIMQRDPKTKKPLGDPDKPEQRIAPPQVTEGEKYYVSAIERVMNKYMYKTAIRWLYIHKRGQFNGDLVNPLIRMFSQYDSGNGLGVKWRTDFDYKDFFPGKKEKAIRALKRQELKEYKLRKYFPKFTGDMPKMFSVEELATMFHLPGRVALTPGLGRIPSRRSEAPPNLPVGEPVE